VGAKNLDVPELNAQAQLVVGLKPRVTAGSTTTLWFSGHPPLCQFLISESAASLDVVHEYHHCVRANLCVLCAFVCPPPAVFQNLTAFTSGPRFVFVTGSPHARSSENCRFFERRTSETQNYAETSIARILRQANSDESTAFSQKGRGSRLKRKHRPVFGGTDARNSIPARTTAPVTESNCYLF
jgi:hypothetical protein